MFFRIISAFLGVMIIVFFAQFVIDMRAYNKFAEADKRYVRVEIVREKFFDLHSLKKPNDVFAVESERGNISIVFKGLGLSSKMTKYAITKLPEEVGLAFSSYSPNLNDWFSRGKKDGHVVVVEIPVELNEEILGNVGDLALQVDEDNEVFVEKLSSIISSSKGADAIFFPKDEIFTTNISKTLLFVNALKEKKKPYIYKENYTNLYLEEKVREAGLPYIKNYRDLSDVLSKNDLREEFKMAEARVRKGEDILLILDVYPLTVDFVVEWLGNKDHAIYLTKLDEVY